MPGGQYLIKCSDGVPGLTESFSTYTHAPLRQAVCLSVSRAHTRTDAGRQEQEQTGTDTGTKERAHNELGGDLVSGTTCAAEEVGGAGASSSARTTGRSTVFAIVPLLHSIQDMLNAVAS